MRALITAILLICATAAQAGPWLRKKGTSFTAVSFSANYYLETGNQTYFEYGLTDQMTLLADVGMSRLHFTPNIGYATVSLRRSITPADATSKWAYELGLGAGWIGDEVLPHIRTALTWGKGMKWGDKSGWMTVDAAVIWDLTHKLHVTKVDATVGMNFTDITAGMLQVYGVNLDGESIATFAPSLVFSPPNTKFRIQVGAESQLGDIDNSAVKFGLWREF